ncbi:MAG: glycosyltransferase [Bacteroidales bacterium]|nr:glycosyltransferase [Bacteroidales bacterium]
MKICFISLKSYPLFKPAINGMHGGAEVQISLLAKHLAENTTFDVSLMCADYGQKKIELHGKLKIFKTFPFNLFTPFKYAVFLFVFFKINANVYIQRTLTPYSFIIALLCKLSGKKFVYMVAHDSELNGKDMLYGSLTGRFLTHKLFVFSSLVVVQNSFQKEIFEVLFKGTPCVVLKKAVETPELKVDKKKYDCIWLGRAEHWKHPELFLKLAAMNPENNFLMVCPHLSLSYSRKAYKSLQSAAKAIPNLTFITHLTHNLVFEKLSESRIFCSTSDCEGDLPMSTLEAAAMGLPVLLLSIDNYVDDPDKNGIGLHFKGSVEKLNTQLCLLLKDQQMYHEYRLKSEDYIHLHHNKTKIYNKFEDILKDLTKKLK